MRYSHNTNPRSFMDYLLMKVWITILVIIFGVLFYRISYAVQECRWGPCTRDPKTLAFKGCDVKYKGILTPRRMAEIVRSISPLYLECKPIKNIKQKRKTK